MDPAPTIESSAHAFRISPMTLLHTLCMPARYLNTVSDLDRKLNMHHFNIKMIERRRDFHILVIDDADFPPAEALRRNNYNVVHVEDISSISSVAQYQIILCDLLGVGTGMNPSMQGAHLISEIKKNFPEKYVVAYTGGGHGPVVERSIQTADDYLKKDADIEDWCEHLDNAINVLANPVRVWERVRHRLLDAGITPYQLAMLEDTFVRTALKGRDVYEPALFAECDRLDVLPSVRSVMESLIASTLFRLIVGAD